MKHKHLTFVLAMLMSITAGMASAHDFEVDGIYYNITSSSSPYTVAVTYQGAYYNWYTDRYTGSVTIPESVTYNSTTYSVTDIGNYAFGACKSLTSVTIGNSVTEIGFGAFNNCSGLTSVNIPENVTSIGSEAFKYCSGLTSIDIPNSVTAIADYAFSYCSGLTSVTIPNSVTSISERAFYGCSGLKSVTIGTGVLSIGYAAFQSPTKVIWLTNTPPSGYTRAAGTINYVANDQYTSLSGKTVYKYLSSMFEVGGVKYVPVSPSEKTCDAIDCLYDGSTENINIGSTVSFKGVSMTVKDIHSYALYGNTATKNLQVGNQGNIGADAFYGSIGLKTITISNQGDIGNSAFASSEINGTLTINNIGNIGKAAFAKITGSFTVNTNNAGCIETSAFKGSTGMTSLEVGKQVTNVCDTAFSNCSNLTTAKLQNKGILGDVVFRNCNTLQSVTLGSGITSLGEYAFDGCSSLQTVNIPNAVTSIGVRAFQDCEKISTAKIGTGTTAIDEYAFSGCSNLTSIQIGSNVQKIGKGAFNGCSNLPTITIPKAVISIGDYTFAGCTKLEKVIMEEKASEITLGSNGSKPLFSDCPLDSVFIGRNITYPTSNNKGYSPFYRNTSLKRIHIANVETEVSANEFYGCTNLKNVRLGDAISSIGDWAFSGCSSLDYFQIGARTRKIGKEAFSDCTAMTRFISRAATPPTCGSQALDDINKWSCTLTVPKGKTSAYKAAAQWKEFFFMNEGDAVAVVDEKVNVTLSASGYATYYNSLDSYSLPSGLVAKVVTGVEGKKIIYKTIADGAQSNNVVPADVAVMLESKTKQGGTYTLTLSVRDDVYTGANLLEGSDVATRVQPLADEYVYKLSYGPSNSEYSNVFGWYWGAANGGAFDITAHKAWLTLKKSNAVKAYIFDDEITGIEDLGNETPEKQTIYDLQGRKVDHLNRKGIFIVNGKKIVRK